ncbi:tetratricopeptide repeat protein [Cupriavidus sp. AU9028]|uniref:tetratricopeptide repeat protein n=1 Tax=Cupriavidus sp. AU9028 TaxID=2871157 RepID=UPI001C951CDD|nr:tetratricopeptide repeat protein [Cupriavidus sp. AU9028]MBY4896030.1 tetratricopeptide repeat protein [Cupriavidus sp. AU9028]
MSEDTSTLSLRDLQNMFGIPRSTVSALVAAGLVTPHLGKRGEHRFSFQDAVLIRTAHSLRQVRIPPGRVNRALRRLRDWCRDRPLSAMRLSAVAGEIVVIESERQWEVETGQLVMALQPSRDRAGNVLSLGARMEPADADWQSWFEKGCSLEEQNPEQAEAAYRRALQEAPRQLDPYLNLGCMLSDAGRYDEAMQLYRQGLSWLPDAPLLHFNLGVVLEEMGDTDGALRSYHNCIAIAPEMADAHYNAARLHEELGDSHRAIRHFNQYRKHCNRS